jgi:hypothetical protein
MFNGMPDLAEPSREILREKFTKRRYFMADRRNAVAGGAHGTFS